MLRYIHQQVVYNQAKPRNPTRTPMLTPVRPGAMEGFPCFYRAVFGVETGRVIKDSCHFPNKAGMRIRASQTYYCDLIFQNGTGVRFHHLFGSKNAEFANLQLVKSVWFTTSVHWLHFQVATF